jgi:hypothetical protein
MTQGRLCSSGHISAFRVDFEPDCVTILMWINMRALGVAPSLKACDGYSGHGWRRLFLTPKALG